MASRRASSLGDVRPAVCRAPWQVHAVPLATDEGSGRGGPWALTHTPQRVRVATRELTVDTSST